MNKKGNIYTDLKIDIPTVRGVLIEKFKEPIIKEGINITVITWCDKNGEPHSFNGFVSHIEIYNIRRQIFFAWHKHGVLIKSTNIKIQLESEVIAEKIAARKFQERATAKKKR